MIEEIKEKIIKEKVVFLWLGIIVFLLLYILLFNKNQTINEIRLDNLQNAKKYMSWVIEAQDKLKKELDKTNTRINQAQRCIDNNSTVGVASECFIFKK